MSAAGLSPTFVPSRLLANCHVQTAFGTALRRAFLRPHLQRQRIELADGDFVDVDIAGPDTPGPGDRPWTLVLHGLEGSSRSSYVRGMTAALVAAGCEACIVNYRGCSGEPNRLARAYHAGETEDVLAVLERLGAERPGRPFAVVGFSIGGNILMKLLGEDPGRVPAGLVAAAAISPPFDLERCAQHLDRRSRTAAVYRGQLLRTLRRKAVAKLARFPRCVAATPKQLRAAHTFALFDELYTAPVHGFENARDYWQRSSGVRYLPSVRHPLLIVTAQDDPFFPRDYVPRDVVAANACLELVLTEHGGHCGFVGGSLRSPTFWAEHTVLHSLAGHLGRR
ncbi:MAG: hydrolase [Planctomycetota bacterium]